MSSATLLMRSFSRISMEKCMRLRSVAPSVGTVRFSSYYTKAHEYAKVDGKIAAVGITDYAQTALGDIVYVDLPEVGDEFEAGESFASVESVKAASDVYCPVGGTIVEINETLTDQPDLVNESPEDDAWFVKIEMEESADPTTLMTAEQYKAYVEEADSS